MKFLSLESLRNGLAASAVLLVVSCGAGGDGSASDNDSITAAPADTAQIGKIPDLKPKGPKPEWASSITDNMLVVIEKLQTLGGKPIETLTAAEARMQPTPTDAVMEIMKENSIPIPPPMVDTAGKDIPVKGGTVHARVYTPRVAKDKYPVVVYYHGGGWVIADLDTYDASAKGLAEQTGAVVVSVHYRQGPEHKFPTAHNDAFAAYEWVIKNAAELKVDTAHVAVAGESAGGNLACNVSIMARDKKTRVPDYQVLVYPVANNDTAAESYGKYAMAKPLNKAMMGWFVKNYIGNPAGAGDKRIALVKGNLKGLPPTTIIGAEIDPLMSEGKVLADALEKADVKVNYKLYNGVTHEFYGMAAVVPEAKEAQALASGDIKSAFEK